MAIHLVLLYVVVNLQGWGWFPFLTPEFAQVLPWIAASLVLQILALVTYMVFEDRSLRSLGEIATNVVTIVVTLRILSVFPFDFSVYTLRWDIVARVVLGLAVFGAGIGVITQAVELMRLMTEERRFR